MTLELAIKKLKGKETGYKLEGALKEAVIEAEEFEAIKCEVVECLVCGEEVDAFELYIHNGHNYCHKCFHN